MGSYTEEMLCEHKFCHNRSHPKCNNLNNTIVLAPLQGGQRSDTRNAAAVEIEDRLESFSLDLKHLLNSDSFQNSRQESLSTWNI